ncbi:MAG TPA: hypothetical protein VF828_04750 [Patescibacteria group bacterium]
MLRLRRISETYHMLIHLLFGLSAFGLSLSLFPHQSVPVSISLSLMASLVPDLDHFLFYFTYGSKTDYARRVKGYLKKGQFGQYVAFCKANHKNNTTILSHNIGFYIISLLLSAVFFSFGHLYLGTFFLSWSYHYMFDMCEDMLFFGRLNPNWLFQFNRQRLPL